VLPSYRPGQAEAARPFDRYAQGGGDDSARAGRRSHIIKRFCLGAGPCPAGDAGRRRQQPCGDSCCLRAARSARCRIVPPTRTLCRRLRLARARGEACERVGIARKSLIVGSRLGFGKTRRTNLRCCGRDRRVARSRLPVLLGASRKSSLDG